MRPFLEWLAAHVEPYVSFRWVIGVVLGAMGMQSLLALLLFVRDVRRPAPELGAREQQLARIGRSYGTLLLLRALSIETLRRHSGLLAQIAVLLALAVGLNVWVFTHG